jgi:endonuclease-3
MSRVGPDLNPDKLRKLHVEEIANLIRPSGMHRIKSKTILNVLSALDDDALMNKEPSELRNILLGIPGIGPKTTDVFLLMHRGYPTFPIDTHIRRILIRLGIVSKNWRYDQIRDVVMKILPEDKYLNAHLLLIHHGRKYCKAIKPLCEECPIRKLCPRLV